MIYYMVNRIYSDANILLLLLHKSYKKLFKHLLTESTSAFASSWLIRKGLPSTAVFALQYDKAIYTNQLLSY